MRHVLSLRQLRLGLREPSRKAVARSARLLDQFGQRLGRAWRETDEADTDFEALIRDLLEGQYNNPVRVVAFNTAEGWSRDVSDDVADELRERCAERGEVPASIAEFLERHDTGRPIQLLLPIAV